MLNIIIRTLMCHVSVNLVGEATSLEIEFGHLSQTSIRYTGGKSVSTEIEES